MPRKPRCLVFGVWCLDFGFGLGLGLGFWIMECHCHGIFNHRMIAIKHMHVIAGGLLRCLHHHRHRHHQSWLNYTWLCASRSRFPWEATNSMHTQQHIFNLLYNIFDLINWITTSGLPDKHPPHCSLSSSAHTILISSIGSSPPGLPDKQPLTLQPHLHTTIPRSHQLDHHRFCLTSNHHNAVIFICNRQSLQSDYHRFA